MEEKLTPLVSECSKSTVLLLSHGQAVHPAPTTGSARHLTLLQATQDPLSV